MAQPLWQIVRGASEPPAQTRRLRAGPVDATLDNIDLCNVSIGDVELLRRVYVAVRDTDWETVPGQPRHIVINESEAAFEVTFDVRHCNDDIDFSWQGRILGDETGQIVFSLDGSAGRDMYYNRIGLCLLLPCSTLAGKRFRALTPEGLWEGCLPDAIEPQRIQDGLLLGIHPEASRLQIDVEEKATLTLEFEGDFFETEDQRNWTDATFKTYSTPLRLGVPRHLEAGAALAQRAVVSAHGIERPRVTDSSPVRITVGHPTGALVPDVGVGLGSPIRPPSSEQLSRLMALRARHLRYDCHLSAPAWEVELVRALETCAALHASLELALFCRMEEPHISRLTAILDGAPLARILVFLEGAVTGKPGETTPHPLVGLVRAACPSGTTLAAGTDFYFCELNRSRPKLDDIDGIVWSMNPQVHAFDDASLLETPEAQGAQVATAHRIAPGKALFVSPVTLLPRFNPHRPSATTDTSGADSRQTALLGAAFTLASLKYLAESGPDAVTYYELTGPRGVVGDTSVSLTDGRAAVFPLFHPLADAAEFAGLPVLSATSDRPRAVVAWAVAGGGGTTVLVANITPRSMTADLSAVSGSGTIRRLNSGTAEFACGSPEAFRAAVYAWRGPRLELDAYETIRLDIPGQH